MTRSKRNCGNTVFTNYESLLRNRLPLEGNRLPDVMLAKKVLDRLTRGKPIAFKATVMVIGASEQAMDVAMAAKRRGARNVSIACLESASEIPASKATRFAAEAAGISIMPSWGLERILTHDERVIAIDLVACNRVYDHKGRFRPRFKGRKECILVDQVILSH